MKNLFKYAASYWKAMIAIVLILVVQAYCDLSLPAYTSDIVNVGIQQGGIEDEVPRQIATEEMEKLLLFVSEDDQQTVMDAYTEDNTSYKKEAYVLKDSVAEEENTMENLKDILQIPMMMTSGIESGSDTTKQMEDKLKEQMSQGMAQSMPQGADQTMPEGMPQGESQAESQAVSLDDMSMFDLLKMLPAEQIATMVEKIEEQMSLFDAIGGIDKVKFSGLEASGWYVESAKEAMESGAMTFAGKYSEPDYETLVDGDCDLAIESTMILHTPKVQEMIEDLGIPVFVDYSSYASHPLGRTEWIKPYGALLNKEEEADTFFDQQAHVIEELKGFENTEKTVAYFYVSTDGSIVVRKSDDYIPSMIEIAGGRYAFKDLKNPDSNAPSVKLTMEEFYATAVDADYLIYNGTIDGQVNSISELEAKNELFSEFKAVKDGNVWYTGKNLYQATDTVGELIKDMHLMLTDGDASQMTFLEKME